MPRVGRFPAASAVDAALLVIVCGLSERCVPLPQNLGGAALGFWLTGHAGSILDVREAPVLFSNALAVGGATFSVAATGAGPQDIRACVPYWLRGHYSTLSFRARSDTPAARADPCVPTPPDVFVENVFLGSDPSCTLHPLIFDGGFEDTGPVDWWTLSNLGGTPPSRRDPHAHSGQFALHMPATGYNTAETPITIPLSQAGGAGPALKFWYDVPLTQPSPVQAEGLNLTQTAGWQQATICLPPPKTMAAPNFVHVLGTGGSDARGPSGEAWLDDFEVTTDPTCPSQ